MPLGRSASGMTCGYIYESPPSFVSQKMSRIEASKETTAYVSTRAGIIIARPTSSGFLLVRFIAAAEAS
ncbi:MAG: hypothetical protein V3V70_03540, partial [Candidatus Scalindua sp.]